MTKAFVDTNVLVRHLTRDPAPMAARATAFLRAAAPGSLLLTDLVVAETIYVLESCYQAPRERVATAVRSLVRFSAVSCLDVDLILRAVEVYEVLPLEFAEAYLVACAESSGVGHVASFDRAIDRVGTVSRVEPPLQPREQGKP